MKNIYVLLFLLLSVVSTQAQEKEQADAARVKGTLIDSATGKPLDYASVAVFDLADSTVLNFGLSDETGGFDLGRLPFATKLRLLVTHVSYGSSTFDFNVTTEMRVKDFDTIILSTNSTLLSEAVVRWEQAPVVIRNDTLEFNADAFKTKPGSMVEELLKKLPGVQVEKDGSVTVNGQKVSKISLDGRSFFSGDPTLLMKNIPTAVVDKVQITAEKDENGRDLNNGQVMINITLKPGAKKGHFGKVYAGYGTDNRYESGVLWNLFRDTLQISILGYGNNISTSGFSMTDLFQLGGFERSGVSYISSSDNGVSLDGLSFGGGQGVTESKGAGVNINHVLKNGLKMNLAYFHNRANTMYTRLSERSTIVNDSTLFSTGNRIQNKSGYEHYVKAELDYKIDTIHSIGYDMHLKSNNRNQLNRQSNVNRFSTENTPRILNNTFSQDSRGYNYDGDLDFSRWIKDKQYLSVSSEHTFYNSFEEDRNDILNSLFSTPWLFDRQLVTRNNNKRGYSLENRAYYWFTIDTLNSMSVNYSLSNQNIKSNIEALRSDSTTGYTPQFVNTLSSDLEEKRLTHLVSIGYSRKVGKLSLYVGTDLVDARINLNAGIPNQLDLRKTYRYISPEVSVYSRKDGFSQLRIGYDYELPSSTDLVNITDITNPQYVRMGNPDLKASRSFTVNAYKYMNKMSTGVNMYLSAWYRLTHDAVIYSNSINEQAVQVTKPINISLPVSDFSTYLSYSKNKKSGEWNNRYGLSFSMGISSSYQEVNQKLNRFERIRFAPGVSYTLDKPDKLDVKVSYSRSFQQSIYFLDLTETNKALGHTAGLEVWYAVTEKWWVESKFNYNLQNNFSTGFSNSFSLWNAAITRRVFKGNKGQLRLSVFDALGQNRSINRTVSANFVEDTVDNAITRYYMLSFVYNLHQFSTGGRTKRGFEFW